ncbi:MAG: hypothetical protein RL213_934 [Bacteroidota bacterium]|jgi:hypothetical protein
MKNLLVVLVSFLVVCSSSAQISNGSFEQWRPYAPGSLLGGVPDGWTTSDSLSQSYSGGPSAFQGADPHDGSSSIHLKSTQITVFIFSLTVPGVATNGNLTGNFTSTSPGLRIDKGVPDNVRSRKLLGYYKYAPQGQDSAHVTVLKWKYDAVNQRRDTIAFGQLALTGQVSSYQPFEVVLVYRDFANQPDSSIIILNSGHLPLTPVLSNPAVVQGTEFIVDELSFSGVVGIDELDQAILSSVRLFPTPASDFLNVEVAAVNPSLRFTCVLTDITGRIMFEKTINQGSERLDVSALPAGNYLMQLLDEDRRIVAARKFSVAR